ncbi:MAG: M28 family peptidase [Candidatus Aminicenantes bacterium]|nr:M28 family peptidase [Candidatus Aminicenantes bacterium]
MKRFVAPFLAVASFLGLAAPFASAQPAEGIPPTLLPLEVLRHIINEASGDLALQNEILIAGVNRNRPPAEYSEGYFEPKFLIDRLKEYGITDCRIIDLPTRSPLTWDAEAGELWIVKPTLRKIADLKEIAASLCSGSSTMDVTAELVYVGPGNQERYYEGKDVKGKIVLVNGSPGAAQRIAVEKLGAAGIVSFGGSHPEFDPDQVPWTSISSAEGMKKSIAFSVSVRRGNDLRDLLERGIGIEVRAWARTSMVPHKDQMVEALIPGTEYTGEELVFSAHVFEGYAKQGANDNISGCVSILETARTLRKLIDEGKIPPLKRSVRFIWIPEISGTQSYLRMHPDIGARFFANINQDMVGEGLIKNQSLFELVQSPWILPSYFNDVMAAFFEWVGTTQRNNERNEAYLPIWGAMGNREPFYYVIDPYSGGSDHVVFAGAGIPAVLLVVWPDQWYHTSGDTPDKADATQLKRAVVIGAASAVFMAGAGPAEAEILLAEVGGRGLERFGREKIKAERMIRQAAPNRLHEAYRSADLHAAMNLVREEETLDSVRFFFREDKGRLEALLQARKSVLSALRRPTAAALEALYRDRCSAAGLAPQKIVLTAEESRLDQLVPRRTEAWKGLFDDQAFAAKRRDIKDAPPVSLGRAEGDVRNAVDGKRSILRIRDFISVGRGTVRLQDVENYMLLLEKAGYVKIGKK